MAEKLNSVQKFYRGKTIFVTGASGFMGKVLVEKLLYSCSELKQLILLMRQKKGKSELTRVKEFEELPLFKRIMDEKPEVMKKILVVSGEITEPNMGMNDANLQLVIDHTNIIFHVAASIRFQAPLKTNISTNLVATNEAISIAKKVKNLVVMVHVSTAFCNIEFSTVNEIVYEASGDPIKLIEIASKMDEKAMAGVEKLLLGSHPNTYTYTKRLAENLVRNEFENCGLPICIVRPSIVGPTLSEPFAGWVDILTSVGGITLGVYKGLLRCMLCNLSANYNFIPVDLAVNGFIMAAKHTGSTALRDQNIPIYNISVSESAAITYRTLFEVVMGLTHVYPFSTALWYPKLKTTTSKFIYWFNVILFQWIPALFADFLLLALGKKQFMFRMQQKIAKGLDSIEFFAMNHFVFRTRNFHNLIETQSEDEYKMFFIDTLKIDSRKYLEDSVVGGRVYQAKDPLETIPKGQRLLRILYVLDLFVKGFFMFMLVKLIWFIPKVMEPSLLRFSQNMTLSEL